MLIWNVIFLVMDANTWVLNDLQLKKNPRLFFTGEVMLWLPLAST